MAEPEKEKEKEVKDITVRMESLRSDEDKDLHLLTEQNHELVVDSPYVAAQTFEELGLPKALLQGIYAKRYNRPSRVQAHALPPILKGLNLIAQSLSGTGKTAAFALGMLSKIDLKLNKPQALCVSPTRELTRQIADVTEELGRFCGARVGLCVPDSPISNSRGPVTDHVLVGTPGKLYHLLSQRRVSAQGIKILVFDEADVMLDRQGLGDQSLLLAKMLQRGTQILLFSATFGDAVASFAETIVPKPVARIGLKISKKVVDLVHQLYVRMPENGDVDAAKFEALERVFESISVGQSIIFVQSKRGADTLAARMVKEGHSLGVIHGDLEPAQRDEVIDDFRAGRTRVLLSTNVLARGIDVLAVSLVVNYELPVDIKGVFDDETYIHRVGRTARYGRSGVALTFVSGPAEMKMLEEMRVRCDCKIAELGYDSIGDIKQMLVECKKSDRDRLRALKIDRTGAGSPASPASASPAPASPAPAAAPEDANAPH